jgi:hypothetical protein
MSGVIRQQERLIEENFFTLPKSHPVLFPIFEKVFLVPVKAQAMERKVVEVHDGCILYTYTLKKSNEHSRPSRNEKKPPKGGRAPLWLFFKVF